MLYLGHMLDMTVFVSCYIKICSRDVFHYLSIYIVPQMFLVDFYD